MKKGDLVYAKQGKAVYSLTGENEDGSFTGTIFVGQQGSAVEITINANDEGYGTVQDAFNSLSPEQYAISAILSKDCGNIEHALIGLAKEVFKLKGEGNEQQTNDSAN